MAHLAQTGQILRLKNRPGKVHDSKQAVAFLWELLDGLRARLGRALPVEFRMDAAFCQRDIFRLLATRRCAYAIKVGYWSWLPAQAVYAQAPQKGLLWRGMDVGTSSLSIAQEALLIHADRYFMPHLFSDWG